MKKTIIAIAALIVLGIGSTARAGLVDIGNGILYSPSQHLMWYSAATSERWYPNVVTWADGLTAGGFDDWRLPTVTPPAGVPGALVYPADDSGELGVLFYDVLGWGPDIGRTDFSPFSNIYSGINLLYTSSPDPNGAGFVYGFDFVTGTYEDIYIGYLYYWTTALAVRSGDVPVTTPEPSTLALAALGLAGAFCLRRKLKK